ncbi:hypothetical protein MFUM_720059 [Methylacidiphilum fumariolicum SolV]|uniref:Uncharacterized protein n=2 Tax=Candidatus Methylacidiphilum fumarolicum TaxID=591154 RepID=I0JZM3_METFB|nr:conserved protein of unknown function [Candidatus Methylacidiphilum fumarolicum]CCG92692.1 hypothetical protein MFUM_720059 [Methylacidiphilum fumariolicum SolV]
MPQESPPFHMDEIVPLRIGRAHFGKDHPEVHRRPEREVNCD